MFRHYVDTFDAKELSPAARWLVAGTAVPALIRTIDQFGLVPMVGHDLARIAEIQATNSDRMHLFHTFDPALQPQHTQADTVVLTLERDRKAVACCGCRLIRIRDSLADEMQSLRFYYSDVARMAQPSEVCVVNAPTAFTIRDCHVALIGAVFVKQGENPIVVKAMLRLVQLWAYAHWKWSWLIGFAERPVARAYGYDVYGYPTAELGVWRHQTEAFLLSAPRRYFEARMIDPSFFDLTIPLCQPIEADRNRALRLTQSVKPLREQAA